MPQLSLLQNSVAVITGGAAGIGLAAAMQFARLGLKVCIADINKDSLSSAAARLSTAAPVDGFMGSCVLLDVKSGTLGGQFAHALALKC